MTPAGVITPPGSPLGNPLVSPVNQPMRPVTQSANPPVSPVNQPANQSTLTQPIINKSTLKRPLANQPISQQSPVKPSSPKGPPPPVPTFPPHLTLSLHRNKSPSKAPPPPPSSSPRFYAIDPVVIPDSSPRESEVKQTPWGPLIHPKVSSRITTDTASTEQSPMPIHRFTVPQQEPRGKQGFTIPSPPIQEQRISETSSQLSQELREIVGKLSMSDVEATLSDDVRVSDILRPSLIDDMIDDMMGI